MEGLSSRVLFRTSIQITGILTIIKGISNAIALVGTVPTSREMIPLALQISSVLIPVFIIAAGVFLLVGSKNMVKKLYPDENEKPDSGEAIFRLAMKILGAVLIVEALPDAVQILSNLIYIKSISPVINTDVNQFIYTRLLSTILSFIIGWYLIKGGQLLVRMAFSDNKKSNDTLDPS